MTAKISDLLAADSLVLAILAVLYSVWYEAINEEISREPQPLPATNQQQYGAMRTILMTRALPLAVASVTAAGVFLPDALRLALNVVRRLVNGHLPPDYNAVSTAFVLVAAATVGLAVHSIGRTVSLHNNRRRFNPNLPPPL